MPNPRYRQIALIASLAWLSWLLMMLIHEAGHVLGAWVTGGTVQRVVWHPLAISRTDVDPNPSPLLVVWAGPLIGSLLPAVVSVIALWRRWRIGYLIAFAGGFCLIANGVYIGFGAFDPIGDAHVMLRHDTPRWLMVVFGVVFTMGGLWFWHRTSDDWLGDDHASPTSADVLSVFALAALVTVIATFAGRGE